MLLLDAIGIKKQYGDRTVLDIPRLCVYQGDRIGIIGDNGAGKSTLLRMICGELEPDQGKVDLRCEAAGIQQFGEHDATRSGGENTKLRIQQQLQRSSSIVFADEPTASLDAAGRAWVEKVLSRAETVLLISHDRTLLDRICNRILEVKDGKVTEYTGNYSDYENAVRLAEEQQKEGYEQYQRKKAQLEQAIDARNRKAAGMKPPSKKGDTQTRLGRDRLAAKQKKIQKTAVVTQRKIDNLDRVDKLRELPKIRIDFALTSPPEGKYVAQGSGIRFSYGDNVVLENASFVIRNRSKTALVGANGSGKTTLLRMIHERYDGIVCPPLLRTGMLYQQYQDLDPNRSVLENAMKDSVQSVASVRSVLAGLLFTGDSIEKPAGVLSGGERVRLSLARLVCGQYNTLLLDEPTNFLDLRAVEAVIRVIQEYPGTVIVISHDEYFVDSVATDRLMLENRQIINLTDRLQPEQRNSSGAEKMLLEMRLAELSARIGSAPAVQKTSLEKQYADTLEQLRRMQ